MANDKGYEPMLKHAKVLGFAVRQHSYARSAQRVVQKVGATAALRPAHITVAKKIAAKKPPSEKPVSKPAAKIPVPEKGVAKKTPPNKAAAKKVQPPAAQKGAKDSLPAKVAKPASGSGNAQARKRLGGIAGRPAEDDRQSAQDE